ncbi:MAG: type II secretion system F family protein [Fimbriimonadaceae bacterium]|nr:type II secretion system F family protein [Fimbriimonadaceae bacterium]
MAVYSYTFKDPSGGLQKGTAEAESEEKLRARFSEQGLEIVEVTLIKKGNIKKARSFGKVKLTRLSLFCRQFSTMVDAGVSLVRCLDVLSRQTEDPKLKKILIDVGERVEGGESLSRAMQRHPRTFNSLFIGLIRAGEVGGVLEEALQRLSQFLEADVALRRKVKAALTYPIIVILAAVGILVLLMVVVVPQFAAIFKDLGLPDSEFPAATKFLIDLSNNMIRNWHIFLIVGIALFFGYKLFVGTRFGRRTVDRIKLKVPVFGPLHLKVCMARFSRTMGTLLTSGVPILQAMETVAGTVGNSIMSDAVLDARARIREGDRIGDPLEASRLFPPMVVHMIGVGEESGSLDFMLQKIADFYEAEVEATLQSLTAALEPIIIVFLGGMVGFIVYAMFAPLLKVITSLSSGDSFENNN